MTGEITAMDTPMTFAFGAATNFTFVTVAAGGAMFAISEAECPTDNSGNECSGIIDACTADTAEALKTCNCPDGKAVSVFHYFPPVEFFTQYSRLPCVIGHLLRTLLPHWDRG